MGRWAPRDLVVDGVFGCGSGLGIHFHGQVLFQGGACEFGGVGGDDDSDECAAAVEEPLDSWRKRGGFVESGEVTEGVTDPHIEQDSGEHADCGGEDVLGQGYFRGAECVVEEGEGKEGAEPGESDDLPSGISDGLVQSG